MIASDLESVLKLRNHPEIRRYMLTQHEITMEEHIKWFKCASQNQGIKLLIFEINDVCSGFVQFKKTNHPSVVDWGFYVAPGAPKGTGRKLGIAALQYAFEQEKFHKICGQALEVNWPSIQFHKSLGFVQEGVLREQHLNGDSSQDLICFGILRKEWIEGELRTGKIL